MSSSKVKRGKKAVKADLPSIASSFSKKKHKILGTTLSVLDDNYQWLPDSSVDLVLTDPPFNIAQDTNFHTYENNTINSYRFDADKGWDSYTPESFIELLNDWAKEFARVLRPGGSFAVFCADDYLSHLIDALTAAGLNPRRTLTWRKPNAVPINRKTMMMSACEYIVTGVKGGNATFNSDLYLENISEIEAIEKVLISDKAAAVVEKAVREALDSFSETGEERVQKIAEVVKGAVEKAGAEAGKRAKAMYVDEGSGWMVRGCVPNYISFNSKAGNRLHPTEKPVTLLSYLVYLLSRPGDIILDPFAGSGSTGEAGLLAGRSVILVEMDNDFYSSLTDRLEKLSKGQ